jgi:hypothetical protein
MPEMSGRLLLAAVVLALASYFSGDAAQTHPVAKPDAVFSGLENPPVPYRRLKDVRVVVAEVADIEESTRYSGAESFAVPQLALVVQHSFSGNVPTNLVADVPFPGAPSKNRSLPAKGDQVVVTMQRESVRKGWTCGRLWPCDKRPDARWVVLEIYKKVNWP